MPKVIERSDCEETFAKVVERSDSRSTPVPQRHHDTQGNIHTSIHIKDTSKLPPGFEDFEHLFSPGLGLVRNHTHKVKLRHNVSPVQARLRRLPMTLRDQVSEEIFKLEREGVIERVDASEWVSPIVVVKKQDGNIRMCIDLRAPNQAVVIDSFPLPHIDELLNSLGGSSYFSKLDLASAYHQVRLDPVSRDLTAFITHEGLFRFKRVCFGLASAPAAFQQIMSKILKDCPGVQFYLDDVIVYGSSLQEHDANLRRVLSRISQAGMKLNCKGVFQVQELSFLGHHLSMKGLAPLSSKVDAVLNFETPSDPHKLKAFLGLVEYYSKFIPHCSTVVEPMRRLLRKGVHFNWSPEVEASFQRVKTSLKKASILSMFNPTLPIVVATDASQYGLGAVLQQQYGNQLRPVAFASRSLTDTERRYSAGEKEALACLWACEKWHVYLWGRSFVIRTDHQALVTLLSNKGSGIRPLRITRWTSRLLNYNFKMEFQRGATNVVADAFSRLPVPDTEEGMKFYEEVVSMVTVPLSKREFQEATANDILLPSVIRYTTSTWPEDISPDLRPYFHVREQLSIFQGMLYKAEKLVVPAQLRDNIIHIAHEVHQGISRTTSVIREHYWWPLMNQEIKVKVENCAVCQSTDRPVKTAPAPLQPVKFPEQPWEKLGLDIVGPVERAPPSQRFFIVLLDYHSKWPEVQATSSVTSTTVITFLKNVFSREGLPCEIVTDNGVQFVSREFQEFLRQQGIKHRRTALYHPQSNGQVERFNRVLKSCLQLAVVQGRPLPDAVRDHLEAYRRTVHPATGFAPSLLLHGRIHRSRLDVQDMPTREAPANFSEQRAQLPERVQVYQDKMKHYSDRRRAVRRPQFQSGQAVRVFKPIHQDKLHSKYTEPQRIQTQIGPATYRMEDGRRWNAAKLTKTSQLPPDQSSVSDWDDDDDDLSTGTTRVPSQVFYPRTVAPFPTVVGPPTHGYSGSLTASRLAASGPPVEPGLPAAPAPAALGSPVEPDLAAATTFSAVGPGPSVDPGQAADPGHPDEPGVTATSARPGPSLDPGQSTDPGRPAVPGSSSVAGPSERPVGELPAPPLAREQAGTRNNFDSPVTSTPLGSRPSTPSSMPPLEGSADETPGDLQVTPGELQVPPAVPEPTAPSGRPRRKKRLPARFKDYVMSMLDSSYESDKSE